MHPERSVWKISAWSGILLQQPCTYSILNLHYFRVIVYLKRDILDGKDIRDLKRGNEFEEKKLGKRKKIQTKREKEYKYEKKRGKGEKISL